VHSFSTGKEAAEFLQTIILPGDVILLKGSQNNIRLERVAEALLRDPADASKLVRQEREWKRR
jgi:UDP-N-acetylmuramyl pentapeptide synthase